PPISFYLPQPRPHAVTPPVPYTTLFRSRYTARQKPGGAAPMPATPDRSGVHWYHTVAVAAAQPWSGSPLSRVAANTVPVMALVPARRSTRLNSRHVERSYAVACLMKKML